MEIEEVLRRGVQEGLAEIYNSGDSGLVNKMIRVSDPFQAERLRTSKFNIKKTPISEFSNASHNGTVGGLVTPRSL